MPKERIGLRRRSMSALAGSLGLWVGCELEAGAAFSLIVSLAVCLWAPIFRVHSADIQDAYADIEGLGRGFRVVRFARGRFDDETVLGDMPWVRPVPSVPPARRGSPLRRRAKRKRRTLKWG